MARAIVDCLLASIRPSANDQPTDLPGAVLDLLALTAHIMRTDGGVYMCIYDGLGSLFKQASKENSSDDGGWSALARRFGGRLLFMPVDLALERVREKRATVLAAYVTTAPFGLSPEQRVEVERWMGEERAAGVREQLGRCLAGQLR